jgi:ABC-type glycerol-3-phosphate transport system substrate-binding protein
MRKSVSRRSVLKGAGAATAGALAGSLLSSPPGHSGLAQESTPAAESGKLPVPLNEPRFAGTTVVPTADEFLGPLFEWYGGHINQEAGLEFGETILFPSYGEIEALMPDLISGGEQPYDLMSYSSVYFGDFVATGQIEPLDRYLEQYSGVDEYTAGVMPAYREFYTKSGGETYGLMCDGDVLVFHYRPSLFEDEDLRNKYEQRFNTPLIVPETWDQYNQTAQFFTEELKDRGIFGTQIQGARPFSFAFWLNIAAPLGVKYFSEDMEPMINSPEAVRALEVWIEQKQWSPPGTENFGGDQMIGNWQQGLVAMSPWWIDLREFSARANTVVGRDVNDTVMPGWEIDGEIMRRATLAFSRTFSIPANKPQEVKDAAFYAMYRLSHPDYSMYSCADPYCGLDPYMDVHYSDEAAELYTVGNPLRGTTDAYPENNGTFPGDLQAAKDHLAAGQANVRVGFPQPNWPGAAEYIDTLSLHLQRGLAGETDAKTALDDAATEWSAIVERRGRAEQEEFYAGFVNAAKSLGYW